MLILREVIHMNTVLHLLSTKVLSIYSGCKLNKTSRHDCYAFRGPFKVFFILVLIINLFTYAKTKTVKSDLWNILASYRLQSNATGLGLNNHNLISQVLYLCNQTYRKNKNNWHHFLLGCEAHLEQKQKESLLRISLSYNVCLNLPHNLLQTAWTPAHVNHIKNGTC